MGRRRWMTSQRLGIAKIDQPLDQLQSIVELLARFEASLDPKGYNRASATREILLGEAVVRRIRESGVIHPIYSAILQQELRNTAPVDHMTFHAQGNRLNPL